MFGLVIGLLMVGGGHIKTGTKAEEQFDPETACEPRIAIGNNRLGKTIVLENMLEKYLCKLGTRAGCLAWNEDGGFTEAIDKDGNGIVTGLGFGEMGN